MSEKFFICESCGELTTQSEIDQELSFGGMGNCGCEYMEQQWDEKEDCFQPIYFRAYGNWTKIPERIYMELKKESNTVLRLRMFRTVPKLILEQKV